MDFAGSPDRLPDFRVVLTAKRRRDERGLLHGDCMCDTGPDVRSGELSEGFVTSPRELV